jgi:hypothetical protein
MLGRYEGFTSDIDAPEWTCMEVNRPLQFRQPREAMAEVFMKIAFWAKNADITLLPAKIVILFAVDVIKVKCI